MILFLGVQPLAKFISNLKKEFDKSIAVVGAKSKEIIETTKIKNQIEELKEVKRRTLQETGEIVYKMSLDPNYNGDAAIKEKCQSLAELDQQIQTKEMELKKLHQDTQEAAGKIICESCGAVMKEGVKFCSNCGAKIIKVEKGESS